MNRMKDGLRLRSNGNFLNDVNTHKDTDGAIATGIDKTPDIERTDFTLWRLKVEHGRQTWHYITPEESKQWPQTIPEKYHLGLETVSPQAFLF
jgi:hypothetical protein